MLRHRLIIFSALLLALAGCAAQGQDAVQSQTHGAPGRSSADGRPVLYDSLGSYSYRITTTSPDAQRWFDQGLRLVYAFNHHEAQKAFREAARIDPKCAMCFWGIALTEGGNYNHPTDADREKRALAAAQQAGALGAEARPAERALIQALAKRHSADPQAKREVLDRAYADAMRDVARQFPDDLEASTFFADAMMNLRPWNLWTRDGTPQPGTQEIVQTLERVIARNPNHPGALHLYIHAVEASGLSECPLRLVVVERVDQPQALIEPSLGVRRRRGDPIRIASERIVENGTTIGGTPSVSSGRLALHGVLSLRRAAGQSEK